MKIVEVNNRTKNLINNLVEIWEDSVRATHTFLANEEIEKVKEEREKNIENSLKNFLNVKIRMNS